MRRVACALLLAAGSANAFIVAPSAFSEVVNAAQRRSEPLRPLVSMAAEGKRGFGEKPNKKKEKSAGQLAREAAAAEYDKTASSGAPEYNIWARPVGTEQFVPAGTMAVPRTVQLADAVYEQEENLRIGLKRTFPKLAGLPLEFGYNLKVFPDEDVKLLVRREATTDPVMKFFEGLLSPLNTSNTKPPQ